LSGAETRTPADFIQLAEETGLIETIGEWVLREACRQFRAWESEGLMLPRVAVNISIRQFRAAAFVEQLQGILRSMGMAPQALELEITEALLHESNSQATAMMAPLDALGVSFALDDFGRGYSSLAALNAFPFRGSRSIRASSPISAKGATTESVAGAIIAMAHGLGKRVVAEGVETEWHAAALVRLGCDHFQGHFCGRPLRAADFTRFSERRCRSRAPVLARAAGGA
jgi:EAL domain-containing protein (putative c-di-GMP-specific phosphodiesterase class I)